MDTSALPRAHRPGDRQIRETYTNILSRLTSNIVENAMANQKDEIPLESQGAGVEVGSSEEKIEKL